MIDERLRIRAIGQFLYFYETDLYYINRFQKFKQEASELYLNDSEFSFTAFLAEFKIIRSIGKQYQRNVLKKVKTWCLSEQCDDVDGLSDYLFKSKYAHGKRPLSFSSKVLFLNNPYYVLPLDSRGMNAIGIRNCTYKDYLNGVKEFINSNKSDLEYCLDVIELMARKVESNFPHLKKIEIIRENRMLDKLLWVIGGQ
ncbi:hypothetical protein [Chitinophaga sancti]|uniref:Uncharacterized protein n=1 Tax=Chitinophaga sancti TaxID=1004 RepID=A0A1K1SI75_9BACT|nr:hypothetical protein [Chitinophaga sancti]WQD61776.1 hypothetical protein U0033_28240 [Chitinophaga sancti]WQG92655.1 hypothetical protein SR876_14145 [Chitinophaga sancti]SFW84051.1 hypothetical protein SAMN05661012_05502 [Chitinophaga sancti]